MKLSLCSIDYNCISSVVISPLGVPSTDATHPDYVPSVYAHVSSSTPKRRISDERRYQRAKKRRTEINEQEIKQRKEGENTEEAVSALLSLSAQQGKFTERGLFQCTQYNQC